MPLFTIEDIRSVGPPASTDTRAPRPRKERLNTETSCLMRTGPSDGGWKLIRRLGGAAEMRERVQEITIPKYLELEQPSPKRKAFHNTETVCVEGDRTTSLVRRDGDGYLRKYPAGDRGNSFTNRTSH